MNKPKAIPLTGTQYEIQAGGYRATVTELGAGLRRLSHDGRPLLTGYDDDELPPGGAGQLLAPWPNRIDGGSYEFGGITCQLELSEATRGNAIHGLTRWVNWTPAAHIAHEITLTHTLLGRPGYPFCLELSANFRLDADTGLQVSVTATNVGSRPAPYGTGCHPYLTTGARHIDDCELELPAAQWLPADDRGIPTDPPKDVTGSRFDFRSSRPIADTALDHALTGLSRDKSGRAWARLHDDSISLGLWAGPGYDWLQVFTGDTLPAAHRRRALAIEPMTCPPNSFVTGDDRITLAPADSVTHTWGLEVL
ncbi:MAG TPA: aldose 1-epimerase family protein [Streptosporangiaceae bacterium]|nr:aldose 1-epimerase family protein [Streptosporangiaceae bacterium]